MRLHLRIPLFLLLTLGTACDSVGPGAEGPEEAATVSADWPAENAQLTNTDILAIQSGALTATLNQRLASSEVQQVEVRLLDGSGKTSVDMLLVEKAIYEMQSQPPAEQTRSLIAMHTLLAGVVRASTSSGNGLFQATAAATSPWSSNGAQWLESQIPGKLVLRVGFTKDDTREVYATIEGQNVTFNPNAPKAEYRTKKSGYPWGY